MAYVYLLCDSGQDNVFKIGVTRGDIEKRIKKLQTGNGEEIFLAGKYETENPFMIEKMMHNKYYPEKKLNEWFFMEADDVVHFEDNCREFDENLKVIKDNPFMKKYNIK